MKILVTGAAGFIGYAGNLGNLEPVAGGFTFVCGDVCDVTLPRADR